MRKKDYEEIAKAIKLARGARKLSRLETVLQLQVRLSDYFKSENPNFDARKFEIACMSGLSEEEQTIYENARDTFLKENGA